MASSSIFGTTVGKCAYASTEVRNTSLRCQTTCCSVWSYREGAHVQTRSDGAAGMVTGRTELAGRVIYDLDATGWVSAFGSGGQPAPGASDGSTRDSCETGEARSPFNMNLRIAGTRLLFQHQFDDFSSLSNSRVDIKPHQVAVLHRVAEPRIPHRLPPRRRGRTRQDDRGRSGHQGAQSTRRGRARPWSSRHRG